MFPKSIHSDKKLYALWSWIPFPENGSRAVHLLVIASALHRIVMLSVLPFIPVLYADTPWNAQIYIACFLFGQVFSALLASFLMDTGKTTPSYLARLSGILFPACLLLAFFSENRVLQPLGFLCSGSCLGILGTVTLSLFLCAKQQADEVAFHYKYWAGNVASVVGLLLGASLLRESMLLFFICIALGCYFGAVFLSGFFSDVYQIKKHHKEPQEKIFGFVLGSLFLINLVVLLVHQQITTNLPIQLIQQNPDKGAFIYSSFLFVHVLILIFFQKKCLFNTNKRAFLFSLGLPLGILCLFSESLSLFCLGTLLYTLGEMVFFPKLNLTLDKLSKHQGATLNFSVVQLSRMGLVLGGPLGLLLMDQCGQRVGILILTGASFLALLCFYLFRRSVT